MFNVSNNKEKKQQGEVVRICRYIFIIATSTLVEIGA